ncbi:MAG: hypothetical protein AAB508_04285 [Patescibacteria group bacterium]
MDLSGPGLSYILLVIPSLFAVAVVGQGVSKLSKNDKSGWIPASFGALFIVLILVAYFFFL